MPTPTGNEIKTQIKTLLAPVLSTAATKKAKIIDFLAYAYRPESGADPTNLRSELDPVTLPEGGGVVDRINCLMISEGGFSQSAPPPDDTRLIRTARGKNTLSRTLFLTYFYQFGDESELTFSDNVDLIRRTLNLNPKLGFAELSGMIAGPAQFIENHDKWQVPEFPVLKLGTTWAHVADGPLVVRVMEPLEGS